MKEFLKNPKLKNPYLWISLIALMFGAAGIIKYQFLVQLRIAF